MAISGSSFTYNGRSSEEFGVMLVTFDSGKTQQNLGLTLETISDSPARSRKKIFYGTKYNSELTFQVTVVNTDGSYLTDADVRRINRWLTGYQFHKKLIIENESREVLNTYFNALFVDVSAETNGDIMGLTYDVVCDAAYGWEDFSQSYAITLVNQPISFYNDSDEIDDYLYPTVTITMTADADFTLTNALDPTNSIILNNLISGEIITMDCLHEKITSSRTGRTTSIGSLTDFNHHWLRLLSGINTLTVNGNCTLKISGAYPRKVGV